MVGFVENLISKACADLKTSQDQDDEPAGRGVIARLIRDADLETVEHLILDLLIAGKSWMLPSPTNVSLGVNKHNFVHVTLRI